MVDVTCRRSLVGLLVLGAFTGCGGAGTDTTRSTATVVIGLPTDVQNWNPYLSEDQTTDWVLALLYPSLFVEQADYQDHPPSFTPNLARSWAWSDDGLELTIELQAGARWSDGEPVTAEDVVFSWRAATSPEVGWYSASAAADIQDVTAVGADTVNVRFRRRYPYMLMDLNDTPIIPAHAWSGIAFTDWADTDWRPLAVSAGPFQAAEWVPNQEIRFEPNPGYWRRDLPHLERVVWRVVPSLQALLTQLLSGSLDVMYSVPASDADRVRADTDLELREVAGRGYVHVVWNLRRPPLDDAAVRRAMAMAVNRTAIIEAVYRGTAEPSLGPVLSDMWAFDHSLEPVTFDPDGARSLLAESGWRDSDGDGVLDHEGQDLEFELATLSESESRQDIVRLIVGDLARVGIRAVPRFTEWGTLVARLEQGDFDAVVNRWSEPTKIDLRGIWHSPPEDGWSYNYGGYHDPEVDRLIEQVESLPDFSDQKPLLDRIQELIVDAQPYLFLVEPKRLTALSRRIDGAEINDATPFFNLEEWRAEPRP